MGHRHLRAVVVALVLAAAGFAAAPAQGRVLVVAGKGPEVVLVGVNGDRGIRRVALGERPRDVAVSDDGVLAWVLGAGRAIPVDLGRATAGTPLAVPRGSTALAVAPGGRRIVTAAGRILTVLDARSGARRGRLALAAPPRRLALAPAGSRGVAVLRDGRVALLDLGRRRVVRTLRVAGALEAAFDGPNRVWTLSRAGELLGFTARSGLARGRLRLGRERAGGLAISPAGRIALVGASAGAGRATFVDLRRGRVLGTVRGGRGRGLPAISPDGVRAYLADSRGGRLDVLSLARRRRLATTELGTARPSRLALQPVGVQVGTEGPDVLRGDRGPDWLVGLGYGDWLTGSRGRDRLDGGEGEDVLIGGTGSDALFGGPGGDALRGQGGNDELEGEGGSDVGDGGTGNDQVAGGDGDDRLDGGDGDDRLDGGPGDDRLIERRFGSDPLLDGGPGNDVIDSGRGSDAIDGGPGDDQLFGATGAETIWAGVGDDTVDGGRAGDRVFAQAGDDDVRGDAGRDTLYGGDGADSLDGGSAADRLRAGPGDDEVIGGSGRDAIVTSGGDDTIRVADSDADTVDCGTGTDQVFVESDAPSRDRLSDCELVTPIAPEPTTEAPPPSIRAGGRGNDVLSGGGGPDSLFGGGGNDKLYGHGGNDYVDGVDGDDELRGGPGDDTLAGRGGNDAVFGDADDDHLTGDAGDDVLHGGDGKDRIYGNGGADRVLGGRGDDRINVVNSDVDRVECGPGRDVVYADAPDVVARDCENVRR